MSGTTGIIFNIMKFCVHDGPGIRTTVFLKGCPLGCWWCHNPEGLAEHRELSFRQDRCLLCGACYDACPNGAVEVRDGSFLPIRERCQRCGACVEVCFSGAREMVGREVTVTEVIEEVEKDMVFYEVSGGGVTFSGGEPFMQPDFLAALLESCRGKGIHTAIDTAGYAPADTLRHISERTDLFLYDLKIVDDEIHKAYTGVSNELILENLRMLASLRDDVVIRIPLIPGINDSEESISDIHHFISTLETVRKVHLLPFHKAGRDKYAKIGLTCRLPEIEPIAGERVREIAEMFESKAVAVTVGG